METVVRALFSPLLGSWAGSEEQAASPWAPASGTRAMIVFKLDVADAVVLQDYRQVSADGSEFSAHGVFMATPDSAVRWWLFDSYGEPPEVAHGQWRDSELVLVKQTARGSAEHRFTVTDDQLTYRIEVRLAGAGPSTFLTGRYRRVSDH